MSDSALIARGTASRWLWIGLWLSLAALVGALAIDARARQVPVVWGALWFLPLIMLLPGIVRDRLRTIAWFCLVLLLYFVFGVLRVFAEPHSLRAVTELGSVILLFVFAMFYIRQRGREVRAARNTAPREDEA